MNFQKLKLSLLILFFVPSFVYSQFDETGKIKITPAEFKGEVYSLGDKGIALAYHKKRNLMVDFYDVNLKKNYSYSFQPERAIIINVRQYTNSIFYDSILNKVLFIHGKNFSYTNVDGSGIQTNRLIMPRKFYFKHTNMVTSGKNTYIIAVKVKGILFEKEKYTTLAKVHWKTGKLEPLPLMKDWKKRKMLNLSYVNDKYFSVMYQDNTNKKQKYRNIALFNDDGEIVVKKLITSKAKSRPIIDYKIAEFDNSEIIVFGSYGASLVSDYSRGIIYTKQVNFKTVYIKHIDLISIKNFYSYLPEKQKSKVEKRMEKRKKKGKQIDVVTYSHQPLKINNTLILTSEFCYPTYRAESRYVADSKGGHYETVWVFDGYVYTHALIIGIDSSGEKRFEHIIPVNLDFKKYDKIQTLKLNINEDVVNYSYAYKGQIFHYSIEDGELEVHKPLDINTEKDKNSDSKKKDVVFSDLNHWYGNYYFTTNMIVSNVKKKSNKTVKLKEFFIVKYELKLDN